LKDVWKPRRVFICFPGINERVWRVLWQGETQSFNSEGRAVEFALECAASGGGTRVVEIMQETASGGWRHLNLPGR